MIKNILFTAFTTIVLIGSLQAQSTVKVNLPSETKINNWLSEYNVPVIGIGIVENGKIKDIKVFGKLENGLLAPKNTIFHVASLTKPLVTMLTLKLENEGKWNLDEPLYHYWVDPDVAKDSLHKKLTTRHILTHQTGFDNWRMKGGLTFNFEPGTNHKYSGEGFEYLRKSLERKFNKTLIELVQSYIFLPLNMNDAKLDWDNEIEESRFAHWHDANGNINTPSTPKNNGVNAAASLLTTIEDYCKFITDVINGAGLSQKTYGDMVSPHVEIKKHYSHGLGWEVIQDLQNGEYALRHGGSQAGVKTVTILLPKTKRGIVIFTNGDNGGTVYNHIISESLDVGEDIINYMKGSTSHEAIQLSEMTLQGYIGNYKDSNGRTYSISVKENALQISAAGIPTSLMYPEKENKFFSREMDIQFEFIEGDSLIIYAEGKLYASAKKVK